MEEWKMIPGYECRYLISNYGRVKSMARIVKSGNGAKRIVDECIIEQQVSNVGYKRVALRKIGSKQSKYHSIHKLVALAFLGESELPQVNHKDGNKLNNMVDNLEYCTMSENMIHAWDNNLIKKASGEKNGSNKISTQSLYVIRERVANGELPSTICKDFNVSKGSIVEMCSGKTWGHIDFLLEECKQVLHSRDRIKRPR